MIVIDIGCSPAGGDSIGYLVREFSPDLLYGFDPSPATEVGVWEIDRTIVTVERKAAWIRDGWLGWVPYGYGVTTELEDEGMPVRCFDLAEFILKLDSDYILKCDCESAEYPILERMIETGAVDKMQRLWIEWHYFNEGDAERRNAIVDALSCEIHSWNL